MKPEAIKRCSRCGEDRLLTDYPPRKNRPSGISSPCKFCRRTLTREWREANPALVAEQRRQLREKRPKVGPSKADPQKYKARKTLQRAVERGKIQKPSACERCGKECLTHGHHSDYSKPLEVEWLCPTCHGAEHRLEAA